MISLRYHAVSLAAVFLALAVGVVLGASGVSERLLSAVVNDREDLAGQVRTLTVERDGLAAASRAAEEFARRVGPAAVRGTLVDRTVAVVTAGADEADRDAVSALVGQAGGTVTGEVALTAAVGDPARAEQLRGLAATLLPSGVQLPASTDTGSLLGGLLTGVLVAPADRPPVTPEQATAVLDGLAASGFVTPGPVAQPAELVLVLTGGALTGVDAGDAAAVTARLAAELDRSGAAGVVLAGRDGSASATGAVGVARADRSIGGGLSTVDDLGSGPGRVAAVLALGEQLDGRAGSYGSGSGAVDGAAPSP